MLSRLKKLKFSIFEGAIDTYSAHVSEAGNLEGHDEEAAIEEEKVALPEAGVVMSLKVNCFRHRPDGCSSHY